MEKVVILLNPSSGRGRSGNRRGQIEREFKSFGIGFDLFVSSSEENLRELADESLKKYEIIVAAGGDTTFNIVASRILRNPGPDHPVLGMIGTGSANDICRGLGIDRIQSLCRAILSRQFKKMDVGQVQADGLEEGRLFLGSMSLGLGTAVNRYLADFSRNHPLLSRSDAIGQILAGGVGVFQAFSRKSVPMTLRLYHETGKTEVSFSLLVFLNTGYFANGLNLSPRASAFDGLLEGVIVQTESVWHTLRLRQAVRRGNHEDRKEFQLIRSDRFDLESEVGRDFQLDGEIFRNHKRCQVSVLPSALDVLVPLDYNMTVPGRIPGMAAG